jgi:VIT1/CCC1 family predicted Fe2+/Mn2+ transporter
MKQRMKKYLPEFVYGSIDGIVTTFAIISGVVGAGLDPAIVIILGVSNVLADGFSMASSNYLSQKSEDAQGGLQTRPYKEALVTFVSFVAVGSIPLISFIVSFAFGWFRSNEFPVAIALTSIAFILVGDIRGRLTNTSHIRAAAETLLVGGIAASVAYFVGKLLEGLV